MSLGTDVIAQLQAEHHRANADAWTRFRHISAMVIGPTQALLGESWPLAGLSTAAGYSDHADGEEAGKAAALGLAPTYENSEDDHLRDKELTYSVLGGMVINDFRNKHYGSALFVTGIMGAHAVRDRMQATVRAEGHEQEVDVKAIPVNQAKTVVMDVAFAWGTSPLATSERGRTVRNAALAAGTVLGIIGHGIFRHKINQEIAAKNAQDGTSQAPSPGIRLVDSPSISPLGRRRAARRS